MAETSRDKAPAMTNEEPPRVCSCHPVPTPRILSDTGWSRSRQGASCWLG